jgi:D-alanyl-D-alanine dipeptidase
MTILLCDPRVAAIPVIGSTEPLVRLGRPYGPDRAWVRAGLARRLDQAQASLPVGIRFGVVEGHRSPTDQLAIIARYSAEICALRPGISAGELDHLTSRFVAPLAVAPHIAGAAIDVTLVDACGDELDLGTPIDTTPEQSDGRCYFDAGDIGADARANRDLLGAALCDVGLVNYPTEWWHWSYGDRYWALITGAPAALYGPVETVAVAA